MSEQESGNHGHPDASDELDNDVEAHKHSGDRQKHQHAPAAAKSDGDDFEAHKHSGDRQKHSGDRQNEATDKGGADFEAHKHSGDRQKHSGDRQEQTDGGDDVEAHVFGTE